MIQKEPTLEDLQRKVIELEDLLQQLRIGRRILMNLLETTQKEQRKMIFKLEKENQLLKRKNKRYVEALIETKWRI